MKEFMDGTFFQTTLTDGEPQDFSMEGAPIPATIWTNPASGDTVEISISTDNGVSWVLWDNGAVTAYSNATLISGITSIRFQRTAGTGITSTCGVC